ncbi:hypothetical protein L916_06966 [Phytophthora nicotianae]|nr:hypothetical protein L916_06966 [Phytophthora nicotianae]
MRVAIAGAGSFAKYFAEEFPKAGLEVVILTGSQKYFCDGKPGVIEQRIADYQSVPQLVELLKDCDALVSTIASMNRGLADSQLALVEACKQTPKCKRFIPAEFCHNSEDYPDPDRVHPYNKMIKDTLKAQSDLEWTVASIGWVMDYMVSSTNRYHPDIDGMFPLDIKANTLTIPGSGNGPFALTSVRDVAKAVAALLKSPAKWRHHTYVQGEETTWLKVAESLTSAKKVSDLKIIFEDVEQLEEVVRRKDPALIAVMAEFKLYTPQGKLRFDQQKVRRDHQELFPNMHFSTILELLEKTEKNPSAIV